jgi:GDP-L-fucose synthase
VLNGEDPFQIWSDGTQKRDWIHIDDIIEACMKIVEADYQHPVNLATGRGVSFVQLAEMFGAKNVELLTDKPRGCSYRVGSSDLMRQFYTPKITIEQGIERALRENK